MSALWVALVLASVGCYALKLAGVAVPASVLNHPRVQRVAALLPIAMLAALVVVELLDDGGRYGWDPAALAGVGVGVLALLARQGVLVVFGAAVGATALLRLLL
jgi:branched-subunit amino acid transport protein